MPWERGKPTDEEIKQRSIQIIRMRWEAYKVIEAGGIYPTRDKDLYKSVRKRLKSTFRDDEKLSRFKLLEDEPRKD